jgi:hypothetical protein
LLSFSNGSPSRVMRSNLNCSSNKPNVIFAILNYFQPWTNENTELLHIKSFWNYPLARINPLVLFPFTERLPYIFVIFLTVRRLP